MRKTSFLIAALALVGATSGCDKASRPSSSSQAQAPQGLPAGGGGGGGTAPSGMPGVHDDPAANPHAGMDMNNPHGGAMGGGNMQGTMPEPGPLDPASVIEGTIEVAPALAGKVKPGDVIFLSLKAIDPQTGELKRPPLAVDRIEIQQLPQTFVLSNQNQMMAGTKIEGQVAITARVDRDADAMTRAGGDLEGVVKTAPPQKGLKVVIDTEVQ